MDMITRLPLTRHLPQMQLMIVAFGGGLGWRWRASPRHAAFGRPGKGELDLTDIDVVMKP